MKYQDNDYPHQLPIHHQLQFQQLTTLNDNHQLPQYQTTSIANNNNNTTLTSGTNSTSMITMDSEDIHSALVFYEAHQVYRIVRMELISSYNGQPIEIGNDVYAKESDMGIAEKANLIFSGKYDDCEDVHDQLMKAYMVSKTQQQQQSDNSIYTSSSTPVATSSGVGISARKKVKTREPTEDELLLQRLKTENEELKKKNTSLSLNYDRLQTRLLEMKTKVFEKDQEIGQISAELELTKETLAALESAKNVNSGGGGGGDNANCTCKKMHADVKDIKRILQDIRRGSSVNALMPSGAEDSDPGSDVSNMVKLHPTSVTLVNRFRFSSARCTESGTAYCQRILTAVFSYQEVMGATMCGRSIPNKRRNPDSDADDDAVDNRKGLPTQKLNDLIESVNFHYPDIAHGTIKYNINWKLNYLNKGKASQTDYQSWDGFDPDDFARVQAKFIAHKKSLC